jgi:hypothetical protein
VDLDISKVLGVHLVRVVIQNGEICVFPDFDGSKAIVSIQDVRSVDSDRAKSPVDGDSFPRREDSFSIGTYSVYRAPSSQQR